MKKENATPLIRQYLILLRFFIANIDFLYGTSDVMNCDYIVISRSESPELYSLVETLQQNHDIKDRILAYARELNRKEQKGIKKKVCFFIKFNSVIFIVLFPTICNFPMSIFRRTMSDKNTKFF